LGYFLEKLYFLSKRCGYPIEPFLTRGEVYKVGRSHYFDISRAHRDFGYRPSFGTDVGSKRIAEFYKLASSKDNKYFFRFAEWYWWFLCVGGLSLTCAIGYQLVSYKDPSYSNFSHGCDYCIFVKGALAYVYSSLEALALLLFRSRLGVQVVFWLAILAHVIESALAVLTARRIGCEGVIVWIWGVQTIFLGFPSLGLLQAREKKMQQLVGRLNNKDE
jgi:hypothetical protein